VIALVVARTTGGTGRHVHAVVRALRDARREVVVAGPESVEEVFGFAAAGATFVPVEVATGPRPLSDARAVRRLRPLLRDAELVHAHGIRAAALAGWAAPRAVPLVTTWHNAVLGPPLRRRLWATVERRVARRATVTLCVSRDLVERVRSLGGPDVRLAPVGARLRPATRTADEVRTELDARDRPLVVAAGRLTGQKGYDLLLDAAAVWEVRTPRPRTVIAGDGPLRAALAEEVERRGLDVLLAGARGDVPDLFAAADVVALPSRWEGSPLAAHEALYSGTPLVATAVGGVPDLAGDGGDAAAVLVPPGDARAFAAAVLRLLDDPAAARAVGDAGRRRAAVWPDEDESARRVLAVYDELLAAP
jgi:glycosyltransferase involved in cell wall biosynthesis